MSDISNGPRGPLLWSALRGEEQQEFWGEFECALYGTARVVGHARYHQVEIVSAVSPYDPIGHPTAFVRFYTPRPDGERERPLRLTTDTELFHGGSVDEEVAALLSLIGHTRCRTGGTVRLADVGSKFGSPVEAMHFPPPVPRPTGGYTALPTLGDQIDLGEAMPRLIQFASLGPEQAMTLLRAVRSYQTAVWFVDDDMSLAWLRLVTAVETVAKYWARDAREDPVDLFTNVKPDLARSLRDLGVEPLRIVAEEFAPTLRLAARFRRFLIANRPNPPEPRPPDAFCIPWANNKFMKGAFTKIYDYRSQALHDGRPFPVPMCEPPHHVPGEEGDGLRLAEKPIGVAASVMGGTWNEADTPMTLATFEYIVQGALLRWLDEGCPSEASIGDG